MGRSQHVLILPAVMAVGLLAVSPATTEAQRRSVRGGARVSVFVVGGHYYPPYYYRPYWDARFWGWYPFGFYPPYPVHAQFELASAAKTLVTPRETEVYVDGYLVGVADDFDGAFQALRLPAGEHEIELYLPGHRSIRQKIRFRPGETYKLRHVMVQLGPGEPDDPKPMPITPPEPPPAPEPREPRVPRAWPGDREAETLGAGTLSIRVQPGHAEVYIDGERWDGPSGFDRLDVQVPDGAHHVEVRKEGYESFSTDVRVRRGETTRLNISLPRVQRL